MIEDPRLVLSYDPDSGVFRWLVTRGKAIAGQVAGTKHSKGYISIGYSGRYYLAHRLAWFFVHGRWPTNQIDHRNRDKTDNRIANLREATNAENHANRGPQRNSTSGVKGVYWFKPQKTWKAQIYVNGKPVFLGYFADKLDAIAARAEASRKYHGAFAYG